MRFTEFTQGMILPKKESGTSSTNSCMSNLTLEDSSTPSVPKNGVKTERKSTEPVKLNLTDLKTSSTMKCAAQDVYNALTRPEVPLGSTELSHIHYNGDD